MPALPVVPNVLKVELLYVYGDKAAANVLHFQFAGGTLAPFDFCATIAENAAAELSAVVDIMGPDIETQGCRVTDLSSDTGLVVFDSSEVAGTRTGGTLPANSAVLASYTVARRYRGGHARQYLPWFTQTDLLSPQSWASASVTEAATAWTAVLASITASTFGGFTITTQVQVGYRPTGPVPKTSFVLTPIAFSVIQPEVASMRRRDGRH